jgi:hypothetical protein
VKQQCESEQFIVINDNLEMDARVFISKQKMRGREQDSGETEREILIETERCWKRGTSSAINKIIEENMWCECEIN